MENVSKKNLVIDLDGTLIKSDVLYESTILLIKQNILNVWLILVWLLKGKAYLKAELAQRIHPDVATLPYNLELLDELRQRKAAGHKLILATASHESIANKIAKHLGIFDETIGSTKSLNLASKNKENELIKRYGEKQFEYYGNSSADFEVWDSAEEVHVINASPGVIREARKRYTAQQCRAKASEFKSFIKAIRIHQWLKNLLIFVPLLSAHQLTEVDKALTILIAFIVFSLCASSVYLLNDALDIEDDRTHHRKKNRPLAAGSLSLLTGVAFVPILFIAAFSISLIFLPLDFLLVLAAYYALTILYSFWLKRIVMLDVVLLALLYTIRVVAGTTAIAQELTFWILAFSVFIFLSLAFVKRYTELYSKRTSNKSEKTPGRGYYPEDFELLSSLGSSAGYISVLVLAMYINDQANSMRYSSPEIMWLACPILMYWLSRVWLIAHRGQMHDDPIVFAVKDRSSQVVGVLFALTFLLAAML